MKSTMTYVKYATTQTTTSHTYAMDVKEVSTPNAYTQKAQRRKKLGYAKNA